MMKSDAMMQTFARVTRFSQPSIVILLAAGALLATAMTLTAAPAPTDGGRAPAPSAEIDRGLLRRLTRDIVNELPNESVTDQASSVDNGAAEPAEAMHRPQVANPAETLDRVAGAMREAGDLLGSAENNERVRKLQDRAVEDLDALIEAARAPPPPSGGSPNQPKPNDEDQPPGDPKPGQPQQAAQSGAQAGTASAIRTDAEAEAEARRSTERAQQWIERVWGHLPEREREQLRQFGTEVFLPGYESLIEDYFRRLAEEANE